MMRRMITLTLTLTLTLTQPPDEDEDEEGRGKKAGGGLFGGRGKKKADPSRESGALFRSGCVDVFHIEFDHDLGEICGAEIRLASMADEPSPTPHTLLTPPLTPHLSPLTSHLSPSPTPSPYPSQVRTYL